MLDTRLSGDILLRCEALFDRVAATPIGANPHALRVALGECEAMERAVSDPVAICRIRDVRYWARLAYGRSLHGYPADALRRNLLCALTRFGAGSRAPS